MYNNKQKSIEIIYKKILSYQPINFTQLIHNNESCQMLHQISQSDNPPHLLIHGMNGSGRYTRVMLFLKEIYGTDVYNMKEQTYTINEDFEISIKTSNFHIEFNPTNYGLRDKATLQWIIEKTNVGPVRKTIIIHEAHKLTKDAQFTVRRAMETGNWRYVFITDNISSLMKPLQSRCLDIRIELPTYEEMKFLLDTIAAKEKYKLLQDDRDAIIMKNNCNLRTCLLHLFMLINFNIKFTPSWKKTCEEIIKNLITTDDITSLLAIYIRPKIIEFINQGLSPQTIMKELFMVCMNSSIDHIYKIGVSQISYKYNKLLNNGKNPWVHVENFIVALCLLLTTQPQQSSN